MNKRKLANDDFFVELFEGEEIDFDATEEVRAGVMSDDDINERYISGEVRIVTEQARYPLNSVSGMVDSDDYELSPEFQRRHRWSQEKQSRLIESFIMNVPVPPIFLYEDEFSHYEVMDGLQRLTAISAFYKDELRLSGLTEWVELNGRTYSELPSQIRRGVDRRYLSSIILLHETAKTPEEAQRLKQLVFERINSGGVALRDQETRNAIYDGPLNRLCIRLSRDPNLCATWGIPLPSEFGTEDPEDQNLAENTTYRTMSDVELVLRFFAHRQRRRVGTGSLRTFLDLYLKQGNHFSGDTLDQLEKLFKNTIALVNETFGEKAFWLWRNRHGHWGWLERPTTTAYDAVMFVFSQHLGEAELIRSKREIFQREITGFYERHKESFDARMTNMSNVRERDSLVESFFQSVISGDFR